MKDHADRPRSRAKMKRYSVYAMILGAVLAAISTISAVWVTISTIAAVFS